MDRVRAYVFTGQDLCTSEQGSLRIINKVQVKQSKPRYISTRPNKAGIEEISSHSLVSPLSLPYYSF